jgi:hypothetical protein
VKSTRSAASLVCERTNKAPVGTRKSEIVRSLAVHTSNLRTATEWERLGHGRGNRLDVGVRPAFTARGVCRKMENREIPGKKDCRRFTPACPGRSKHPPLFVNWTTNQNRSGCFDNSSRIRRKKP